MICHRRAGDPAIPQCVDNGLLVRWRSPKRAKIIEIGLLHRVLADAQDASDLLVGLTLRSQ